MRMDELVNILKWIHIDLEVIAAILICFVLFKNCHGYNHSKIVDELKNIESTIANKKREE